MSAYYRSPEQKEIDSIFEMMEKAIRLNTYEADDLMYMIADLIPASPALAAAISNHAADFIHEREAEHSWTDIVVESYRRSLFDIDASAKYGTSYLTDNIPAMREFVTSYIRNQTLGSNTELTMNNDEVPVAH